MIFGDDGEVGKTLSEITRVLARGGRYLLLDHQDAGPGEVVVRLPADEIETLGKFERKFRCYVVRHAETADKNVRITRRSLQDFLTKDHWLDSDMESIEMNETHNVFNERDATGAVSAAGLQVKEWIGLTDIREDLSRHRGVLVEGDPWFRKFLLVAEKPGSGSEKH
jgi:hypothetical protein